MNAIMVAVDYTDLLRITLPYNRHYFDKVVVVTDPRCAYEVWDVCMANDAHCYATDAFYRRGAHFNKWLALEEGLDHMGRNGWICLMDADVLWPKVTDLTRHLQPGFLYSPLRRMMEQVTLPIPQEDQWRQFPVHRNIHEWAGYSQVFHADDWHLGPPPWHQTDWKHAGGADSMFQAKWSTDYKVRPPFEVLHLGPAGTNWCGRVTPFLDGSLPERAHDRSQALRDYMLTRRRAPAGIHHFDAERLGM